MRPKRYPYQGKKKGPIAVTIDPKGFAKITLEAIHGTFQVTPRL